MRLSLLLSRGIIGLLFLSVSVLQAQSSRDTVALLEKAFQFFHDQEYNRGKVRDSVLRSQSNPDIREVYVSAEFPLLGQPRLRFRKAGCFVFRELVFPLAQYSDTSGMAREWQDRGFKKEELRRADDWLFNLSETAWKDSLKFTVRSDYLAVGLGKKYDAKAYRSLIYVFDELFPLVIVDRQYSYKVLCWVMLEKKAPGRFELQLVLGDFRDDCTGI